MDVLEPFTSLQAAIDAAPAGSTLLVPPGTYRETVTIQKPLVLDGQGQAVIDAEWTRPYWVKVHSDDVTIRGFTMHNATTPNQDGAVQVLGRSRVLIEDNALTDTSNGAPLSIERGSDNTVRDNELARGGQEGLHISAGVGLKVLDNHIHHNNTAHRDPSYEAGGAKLGGASGALLEGNEVDNNNGPGLWSDVASRDVTYRANRVHDNTRIGLYFEASDGVLIEGNSVWNNGKGWPYWGYGGGIVISSSGHAEIRNNTVAWNPDGITVLSQNRGDRMATVGMNVHDNVIVMNEDPTDTSAAYGLAFLQDWAGGLFDSSTGNKASGNRFWFTLPEGQSDRFAWERNYRMLADYARTPAGTSSSYLTQGERDTLLNAAGIPLQP
jgi:nitrous oxidase accessory protein